MEKSDYVETIKNELEVLLEQGNNDYYEKCFNKEDVDIYIAALCEKLSGFDGDKWQLAEIVASTIFEICAPTLPGSGIVAYLVLKIFRNGIETVCKDLNS